MSRPSAAPGAELARELAAVLRGEVRFGTAERTVYSHDASNYRQLPLGGVKPAHPHDVRTARPHRPQIGGAGGAAPGGPTHTRARTRA
ncbi:hypothetical protein, partial [Kitasatospora sp. NPDC059803]|uniref:hypothetical protein n=1 Tax=Kitasatospora sp. NPDC059803 TaxID=3346953 RepID=UPI0036624840